MPSQHSVEDSQDNKSIRTKYPNSRCTNRSKIYGAASRNSSSTLNNLHRNNPSRDSPRSLLMYQRQHRTPSTSTTWQPHCLKEVPLVGASALGALALYRRKSNRTLFQGNRLPPRSSPKRRSQRIPATARRRSFSSTSTMPKGTSASARPSNLLSSAATTLSTTTLRSTS